MLCPNCCFSRKTQLSQKRPKQNLPYKIKRHISNLTWKNRLGSLSSVMESSSGWTQNAIEFNSIKISLSVPKLFFLHSYSQPFLYATVMDFRQINILHASQGCHTLFSVFPLVSAPVKHGNKVISLTCSASKNYFGMHLHITGRFANLNNDILFKNKFSLSWKVGIILGNVLDFPLSWNLCTYQTNSDKAVNTMQH